MRLFLFVCCSESLSYMEAFHGMFISSLMVLHGILTQPARGGSVVFPSTGPRDSIGDWCVFPPIRILVHSTVHEVQPYDIVIDRGAKSNETRVPGPSSRARG